MPEVSADDVMIVNAARCLSNDLACFVGIGLPSTAANLARRLHAPDCVLIYESGCIGSKPTRLPLSIGDGELAETSDAVVSVPEIFAYWLQAGRIDVGFLGAAQLDRFGNINSTVIGDYGHPTTRLPGAGGAPEIAASAGEVIVIIRQNPRSFVERLDFRSTAGFLGGGDERATLGVGGTGPQVAITDLGILKPDPETRELTLVARYENVAADAIRAATGWPLQIAPTVEVIAPPSAIELQTLRELHERTRAAHSNSPPLRQQEPA